MLHSYVGDENPKPRSREIPFPSLSRIFAEVANIPSAIGFLPSTPAALMAGRSRTEPLTWIATSAALAFGLAAAPVAALCFAAPLFVMGRVMQSYEEDLPLAHCMLGIKREKPRHGAIRAG